MHPLPVRRRRPWAGALAALATASAAAAGLASPAHAGTFQVSQCRTIGVSPSTNLTYRTAVWEFHAGAVDGVVSGCAGEGTPLNVWQANRRLHAGEDVLARLTLPAHMSATTITSVDAAYQPHQQSASTNPAYLMVLSGGTRLVEHDMTAAYSTDARRFNVPAGARNFDFYVWCSTAHGPGYCNWTGDTFSVRGLTLTLEESAPPAGAATGALLEAGAQAGVRPLELTGSDADSGIKRIDVTLDGTAVATADFSPDCTQDRFSPCPTEVRRSVDVDTRAVADGVRLLRLKLTDLAGNQTTVNQGYVTVDNVPAPANRTLPAVTGEKRVNRLLTGHAGEWSGSDLAYAYRWERFAAAGWEPIPDATQAHYTTSVHETGMRLRLKVTVSNGEGTTVAYSDATNPIVAPGPTDVDGDFDRDGIRNDADPDDDNDGTADGLDIAPFDPARSVPPRESAAPSPAGSPASASLAVSFAGTRAKTIRARYGQRRRITGRLLTGDGRPLRGVVLDVSQRLLARNAATTRIGTVTTDSTGRFAYTIPAGPSRRITVGYGAREGASSYSHSTSVTVNVTPEVGMRVNRTRLRNGQAVRFAGRVPGMPRGTSKLVELQARAGGSWLTFATVRLSRSGTFTHAYRFTRTTRPTTYNFRVLARAEAGWPFARGQSRTVRVTVRP